MGFEKPKSMSAWKPDALLPGFESLELAFPGDYDGEVVATLVRLPAGDAPRGAVLSVQGYTDYFFQRHMALRFAAEGYAFYAVDLRKYGRSLRPHQHPNFCKRIDEYYADLGKAIDVIGAPVLLAGHSTGGLICSLYADECERQGSRAERVSGLWLNSPFFDLPVPDWGRSQGSFSRGRHGLQRERARGRQGGVSRRENPFGRLVEKQLPHPAADEGVGPRAAAQRVFPDGERAGHADERFRSDEQDRGEVQVAEPGIPHPAPAERGAEPDQEQPAGDEGGDGEVQG